MAKQLDKYTVSFDFKSEGLDKLKTKIGGVKKGLDGLSKPMLIFGGAVTTAVGLAVKAFLPFEENMAKMRGLVGLTREEMEGWEDAMRDISSETASGMGELSDAMFFVTSAGLRGTEALDVLEQSAKASTAGLGDVKTIADLTTSAINAYGSEVLSAGEVTDILTAAVKEGKLEASSLAGSLGSLIPTASALGIEFSEVTAMMAAMSKTGTSAEEASTQLSSVMTALVKPSKELKELFPDILKVVREDGLFAALELIKEGAEGTVPGMAKMIGNVRGLRGMLDLLGPALEDNKKTLDAVANSTGDLDKAYESVEETAGHTFAQLKTVITDTAVVIGGDLAKSFKPVIEGILSMAKEFTALITANTWAGQLTKTILLAGPAILGVGVALKTVSIALGGFSALFGPLKALIVAFGGTNVFQAGLAQAAWFKAKLGVTGFRIAMGAATLGLSFLAGWLIQLIGWLAKKFDWLEKIKKQWYKITGATESYMELDIAQKMRELGLEVKTAEEQLVTLNEALEASDSKIKHLKELKRLFEIGDTDLTQLLEYTFKTTLEEVNEELEASVYWNQALTRKKEDLALATGDATGKTQEQIDAEKRYQEALAALQAQLDALGESSDERADKEKENSENAIDLLQQRIDKAKELITWEDVKLHQMEIEAERLEEIRDLAIDLAAQGPLTPAPLSGMQGIDLSDIKLKGPEGGFKDVGKDIGKGFDLKTVGKSLGTDLLSGIGNAVASGRDIGSTLKDGFKGMATKGLSLGLNALGVPPGVSDALAKIGIALGKKLGKALVAGIKIVAKGIKKIFTFILDGIKKLFELWVKAWKKTFKIIFAPLRWVLKGIRKLLPGSDAEEGPLSDLTKSGEGLSKALAKGIKKGGKELLSTTKGEMGKVGEAMNMSPYWAKMERTFGKTVSNKLRAAMKEKGMLDSPAFQSMAVPSSSYYKGLTAAAAPPINPRTTGPTGGTTINGPINIAVDGTGKDERRIAEEVVRRLNSSEWENAVDKAESPIAY